MRLLRGGARASNHRRLTQRGVALRKFKVKSRVKLPIVPVSPRRYDLRKLIEEITRENSHELIDWGRQVGKENW